MRYEERTEKKSRLKLDSRDLSVNGPTSTYCNAQNLIEAIWKYNVQVKRENPGEGVPRHFSSAKIAPPYYPLSRRPSLPLLTQV